MKNLNRFAIVAVLLTLGAGVMTGCGNNNAEETTGSPSPAPPTAPGANGATGAPAAKPGSAQDTGVMAAPPGVKTDLSGGMK